MSELRGTRTTARPKPSPEAMAVRHAMQRLVQQPEWAVFIEYFRQRIEVETVDPSAPNVSALLMIEGRRSLHRELSDLPRRLSDERSGSSGSE